MTFRTISPNKTTALFVKNILIFEGSDSSQKTILPFFADGYPGLIFQQTKSGLLVNPFNKLMPGLFLYGQTIHPIELIMEGEYQLIIFQLYPFVLKSFFGIEPDSLTDNCYDLAADKQSAGASCLEKLKEETLVKNKCVIIADFIECLFLNKKEDFDIPITKAIQKIINSRGQLSIHDICAELFITERTFERRFLKAVGLTAKQFCKIIQFQQSYQQLTLKDYHKLSDIVYTNGYSDQSHFIKVFKAFTGKTPRAFLSK